MANTRRKTALAPIETNTAEEITQQPAVHEDCNHMTDEMNIDSYLEVAEKENIVDTTEKDIEIEDLKKKVSDYKEKMLSLIKEIDSLKHENEKLSKNDSEKNHSKEIEDKLNSTINENDELILRNSELEFEIARLTETLKTVQKKDDSKLHTYTKPSYNRPGGYRISMNGYQDWR